MKQLAFILPLLLFAPVSAEVYRHTTPDGRVTFSDRPIPGAEEVQVAPLQTYAPVPVPKRTRTPKGQQNKKKFDYIELAILSPANGEAIRANDGNVAVKMTVKPSLGPGHTIVVKMDGEQIRSGSGTNFQLTDLPRGGHTLIAEVVDDKGESLHQSAPITFYVLRVAGG